MCGVCKISYLMNQNGVLKFVFSQAHGGMKEMFRILNVIDMCVIMCNEKCASKHRLCCLSAHWFYLFMKLQEQEM